MADKEEPSTTCPVCGTDFSRDSIYNQVIDNDCGAIPPSSCCYGKPAMEYTLELKRRRDKVGDK